MSSAGNEGKGGSRRRWDFSIEQEADGFSFHAHLPAGAAAANVPPASEHWHFFSPKEARLIRVLLGTPTGLSRAALARELGESPDGWVKTILASLSARQVLLNTEGGYVLNLSPSAREEFRAWLAQLESQPGFEDSASEEPEP